MKKQVTDVQAIHVELDDDDRELMTMFRNRQRIMNDVLLVQENDDKMYIVSKEEIARKQKMIQDILDFSTIAIAVFVILLQTILMAKRVVNPIRCLPWMSAVIVGYMVTRFVVRKYRKNESTMQRL